MSDPSVGAAEPASASRRHYLTILFSDLSDSTRIASAMEAEHYAELLGGLREAYQSVIPKHGGTVVRIQGDGMLAIFGHPKAHEDDGRRATEAALELHDRVRALPFRAAASGAEPLSLHSGIHAGLVLLDTGDLIRGRFELVGDPPNIASRLSDLAGRGEILVSEETLGPERQLFQTGPRELLTLRGRAEPIAAFRILARGAAGSRFAARAQRGLVEFVGRQQELRQLEDGLAEAMAGQPRFVAICAPAGLGKTRLAEEFLGGLAAQRCQVHRGYCESYLGAEPLQPFLQMLQAMSLNPPDAEATGGSRAGSDKTVAALCGLVERLAARAPVLIFIDDLQWADAATRQVLGALRRLHDLPLMVLTATRSVAPAGVRIDDTRLVELAPFTDDEAAETISRLLPRTDPFVVARIRNYAGGNPLFMEELCHSAAQESGDRRLGRALGSAAWLDTLIESRVARLPEAQAAVVRAAAVIGNVIPAWLLERLTGCTLDDPLVHGLAEQDLIFPGEREGTLRFKHGIARDVIYDAVGLHPRRAMHLRIAQVLRERAVSGAVEEGVEALAYHYGAGGQDDEAARFAELAGDKAMAASALDRAQAQYRAALGALDRLDATPDTYRRWAGIAQRLGLASAFDPSRDHLDVLRRAATLGALHDDAATVAQAEHWLGYIHYGLGETLPAIRHCERALDAASHCDNAPLLVQIRATLGQARAAASDYARALPLLDEGIAIKRRHRSGSRPAVGLSYTLACKGAVLGDQGEFIQAQVCFEEALEAVRGADHEVEASVLGWRSAVFLWQGRWAEARQAAADAQRVAERVKSLYIFAMDRALGAYAGWCLDRDPQSLKTVMDATAWLESSDRRLNISLNYGWLAQAMAEGGRTAELRSCAAHVLRRARKQDLHGLAMTLRALATASARAGDPVAAQQWLARALQAAIARNSRHEVAVTRLCEAQLAALRGDAVAAAEPLAMAAAEFDAMEMAWHLAQATALQRSL